MKNWLVKIETRGLKLYSNLCNELFISKRISIFNSFFYI